ncbi:MAG: cell division protein FtsQ/DivIB [Cytophagaceae bacterium]
MLKKFKPDLKIGKKVVILLSVIVLFSLIGFIEAKQDGREVTSVHVNINFEDDNFFVTDQDIMHLITLNGSDKIVGEKFEDIDLKTLEMRIKNNKFVSDAQVYKDHKGTLMIEVKQCRPIARVIQSDAPHAYIGSRGNTLGTSDKFTARVILIDGPGSSNLLSENFLTSDEGSSYLALLNHIDQDKFWKAQLSEMYIDSRGELRFYPQVGNQVIYFGKPDDVENKLKRLKIFYKEILPSKGWNKYKSVNLKFRNQIICE